MSADFDEVRLPDDVASGVKVRRSFSTEITSGENGAEFRRKRWSQSRREYEVVFDVWDQERWDQLDGFHDAREGKLRGFRLRDPAHFLVGYKYAGLGVYALTTAEQVGNGNGTTKSFQSGFTRNGRFRPCKKLATEAAIPLKAFVNGLETAATFDVNTGIFTFSAAPASGATIRWAGPYDVPVRFDTDSIEATFKALIIGKTATIPIVEIQV